MKTAEGSWEDNLRKVASGTSHWYHHGYKQQITHTWKDAGTLTLLTMVYKALSCAPYFRHCLIQVWMVQSLRYQQLGLCRNLNKTQEETILVLSLNIKTQTPSVGPSTEIVFGAVSVLESHESWQLVNTWSETLNWKSETKGKIIKEKFKPIYMFVCFKIESLCSPGWSRSYRSASTSKVFQLKVRVTTSSFIIYLIPCASTSCFNEIYGNYSGTYYSQHYVNT